MESDFRHHLTCNGRVTEIPLQSKKLIETAVPKIRSRHEIRCPGITKRKDPAVRQQLVFERKRAQVEKLLIADEIRNFDDFSKHFRETLKFDGYNVFEAETYVCFYTVSASDSVFEDVLISSKVIVPKTMHIKCSKNDVPVGINDLGVLPKNTKLCLWSQMENVLNHIKHHQVKKESSQSSFEVLSHIGKCLQALMEKDNDLELQKLTFITDQVNLMKSKKHAFTPATYVMAFIIYAQSTAAYELLRNFAILPTVRTLRKLSASFKVSPNASDSKSEKHYLQRIVDTLPAKDRIVALLIDEIYVKSGIIYKKKII